MRAWRGLWGIVFGTFAACGGVTAPSTTSSTSSPGTGSDGGSGELTTGGSASSSGATTAAATTGTFDGGATGTTGSTTGVTTGPVGTLNCDPSTARVGAMCNGTCPLPCGISNLGTNTCVCPVTAAGISVYESCTCPRPSAFAGAAFTDWCYAITPDGTGLTTSLSDTPCSNEWQECIAGDDSTVALGCVCMADAATADAATASALVWQCGPTEDWFSSLYCGGACTVASAKTGNTCTCDCVFGCGFNALGDKYCRCSGGVYAACPCTPPSSWHGAPTAPYCDALTTDGIGMTAALNGKACAVEWQECVGRDANTGTPIGCACLQDPVTMMLTWVCGSTNGWFAPM